MLSHILAPFFIEIGQKIRRSLPETSLDKSVLWGDENSNLGQIFCFTPDLIDFGVGMYLFEIKESIF